jgi:signal transduction histidine kinase
VVSDVLVLARLELAERRVAVHNELPEDLPRISADHVQIQQVLLNLIINAIQSMSEVEDERRILTIRAETSELNRQPAVLMTVHDLGVGFKAEDGERLFDAFYTTRPDGLGMGLRISRSIMEAHGGRLWAQPNDDMGATLLLSLPVESPETV